MNKHLISLTIFVSLFSCAEKYPTQVDGQFRYEVNVIDASGIFVADTTALSNAVVTLESKSYFENNDKPKTFSTVSRADGLASFQNLPSSKYTLIVIKDSVISNPQTGGRDTIHISASREIEITSSDLYDEALYVTFSAPLNIVINEIYYCGPTNSVYYFYDQFIELYNPTNSTVYLDGMFLCKARNSENTEMENNDFVQASYVYQFPGEPKTGRVYPLEAGQFIVVASDGFDHSTVIETSIDLSKADWEFFNPFGQDIDYPPANVENILPEHTTDFLISLIHSSVVLTDGSDWYYGEVKNKSGDQYVHLPISTVIDAVEYSSNAESPKLLTVRLDAGFAGIGMQKYSGKSVQRRAPGYDNNNSNLDFVIIKKPTPGYQN